MSSSSDDDDNLLDLIKGATLNRPTTSTETHKKVASSVKTGKVNKSKLKLKSNSKSKPKPKLEIRSPSPSHILFQSKRPNKALTRLNSRAFASDYDDEEDDEIEIPSIFKTDAVENEKLLKRNKQIQDDIYNETTKVKDEYKKLSNAKASILKELNDNGSSFEYSLTNESQKNLIESLVKNTLRKNLEFGVFRQFYFFRNVYQIKLEGDPDISLPFSLSSSFILITLNEDNFSNFFHNCVKNHFSNFINHTLLNIKNIDNFEQIVKFIHFVSAEYPHHFTYGLTSSQFGKYIDALGGNIKLLDVKNKIKIPIKLGQYQNFTTLLLYRLNLVFNYSMLVSEADNELYYLMVQTFLLTISDFNLNQDIPNIVHIFIKPIFTNLIHWRASYLKKKHFDNQDEDGVDAMLTMSHMIREWHEMMEYTFNTFIYDNEAHPISKKHDYELMYNSLRLINICQHQLDGFVQKFFTGIKLAFIDNDNFPDEKSSLKPSTLFQELNTHNKVKPFTPPMKFFNMIVTKINKLNVLSSSKRQDFESINEIYYGYYKLLLLNSILHSSFTNNENVKENRQNYESIKAENYNQLKKLEKVINSTKNNFHNQLGQVLMIPSDISEYYDKDDLVKLVTDIYYLLDYMHKCLGKDIRLIHEDVFYDH